MRRISKKRAKREAEARPFRETLIERVGRCEICGRIVTWQLGCHEIARGPHRQKALDKPYALLVLCWYCHGEKIHGGKGVWPLERQLAVLKASRPADYDLEAFNKLRRGSKRITEEEVAKCE